MIKTIVLWKNYGTIEKTVVLYQKLWNFDLLWKKLWYYEKKYSIFCYGKHTRFFFIGLWF